MENLADSLVGTIASQSDTCGTTFKVNQVNGMVSSINLRSDKYFYKWHTIQYNTGTDWVFVRRKHTKEDH